MGVVVYGARICSCSWGEQVKNWFESSLRHSGKQYQEGDVIKIISVIKHVVMSSIKVVYNKILDLLSLLLVKSAMLLLKIRLMTA